MLGQCLAHVSTGDGNCWVWPAWVMEAIPAVEGVRSAPQERVGDAAFSCPGTGRFVKE